MYQDSGGEREGGEQVDGEKTKGLTAHKFCWVFNKCKGS